jgi:hypothetical protein
MHRAILTAVLVIVCVSSAYADPVILNGSLTGRFIGGPGLSFSFSGEGFSAQGAAAGANSGIIVFAQLVPFYVAGNSINLSLATIHSLGWPESFGGTLVVNGTTYNLFADSPFNSGHGGFTFTAMTTIPVSNEATMVVTAPFTMSGFLSSQSPSPISISFTGEGIASATLVRNANGSYSFDAVQGVRYSFTSTPTPEPTTISLLASGLAGVGTVVRKRRVQRRVQSRVKPPS